MRLNLEFLTLEEIVITTRPTGGFITQTNMSKRMVFKRKLWVGNKLESNIKINLSGLSHKLNFFISPKFD